MGDVARPGAAARQRRLAEELGELGVVLPRSRWTDLFLEELDYALRPVVHERRVPSVGAVIEPTTDPAGWELGSQLAITHRPIVGYPIGVARRFADGLSSFVLRRASGDDEFVVFDRPAGSERDLVVLAEAMGATIVQRHPGGQVRVVGEWGVLRWDGIAWHQERPISSWIDAVSACGAGDRDVLTRLLTFAVHDLGARRIGSILLYRPSTAAATYEVRLPTPPPLQIGRAADLAPLRHVLAQVDGAAVFDEGGTLRDLGVRLVPSPEAEADVDGFRGMRHTSGRRYSFDDPTSTVIVVSDDGPVTVLRAGEVLGSSSPHAQPAALAIPVADADLVG